ncbi:MAG: molybdate ABC transporter substrate-binding protein [Blastocatellia bacterium]|nr:MAG: molybdate ABC transporter substrate-binding protein [Blastocatellia bacterium]
MPRLGTICVTAGLVLLCLGRSAAAQNLTVAAASDLQSVLPEIASRFERDTGQKVTLTFGSSGNFFTQIQNGAPFDVFLSADIEYPRRLEQERTAEPGSLYEYARGRIVLWTRRDSGVDIARGFGALTTSAVRRVSVANPDHAPYGRAAVAALRAEHVYEQVRGKLIMGENISQAAQFAQSGGAEVGIIALSLALSPALKSSGVYFEVPDSLYPPIEQAAVVIATSRRKPLARQFIEALKKPEVVQVFQSYGFAITASSRP